MNIFTLPLLAFLLFTYTGNGHESPEAVTASIEGTVQLATQQKVVRSGNALYGRPSRQQQSEATADSILIILTGNRSGEFTPPAAAATLNQQNRRFIPRLLPVSIGQTVRIQNSDPIYHNVFSLTSPQKFDVGRRPKGEHFDVIFEKPGPVDVFCDIHSNMHAILYVLPRQTVAWKKVHSGSPFAFEGLEEGNFTLTFYALGYNEVTTELAVAGEGTQIGTVTLTP